MVVNFINDPCGIVCIFVTYLSIAYADYVVIRWIILPNNSLWGSVNAVLINTVIFFLTISHLKAVFCDPGLVEYIHKIDIDDGNLHEWTICTRCEIRRPPRAHHCRICKRCIRRMDHHCPWINVTLNISSAHLILLNNYFFQNCVGEQNQMFFLQFLLYVGVLSIYCIFLVISSWIFPHTTYIEDLPEAQKETRMYIYK